MRQPKWLTRKSVIVVSISAVFPWMPPVLFEKIDFFFHLTHQIDWYYNLSGYRLPVDMATFAVWGIVAAYILRPRWALVQIGLSAILVYALFYVACPIYGPDGVWQPECYNVGPDGLVGVRLVGVMFCFGALPIIVKIASKAKLLSNRARPIIAVLGGVILTIVMVWFPLSAWFSGVTYLAPFAIIQEILLVGIPQIETGVLATRIGKSLKVGPVSGVASLAFLSASNWTSGCPGCDRNGVYFLIPLWAVFGLMGSITELGLPQMIRFPKISGWLDTVRMKDLQRVGTALVITACIATWVIFPFWAQMCSTLRPYLQARGN